jgi:hypothetical protein
MKKLIFASIALLASTVVSAQPNSPSPNWTGVWKITTPGKAGLTITLADDSGALTGTIVFEVMNRETGQHIANEPRTLVNPHLVGNALTFQVKNILKPHLKDDATATNDKPEVDIADMTLTPTAEGKATLTCPKCGDASPTEVVKEK